MIPRIIHTVWLSGDPYPALVRRCMRSWKRVLPGYELKVWTMQNFETQSVQYVREAVGVRKWAPAADYIRLWALWNYGGIYMDSDVFLRPGFEALLDAEFVTSIEAAPGSPDIALQAAVLASVPHHPFVRRCMDYYENRPFILPDGSYDNQIAIAPTVFARMAEADGFRYEDCGQQLDGGMKILPSSTIASSLRRVPAESRAVHCCNGNWNIWVRRSFRQKLYRRSMPLQLALLDWRSRFCCKRKKA